MIVKISHLPIFDCCSRLFNKPGRNNCQS